jgi:hypothetical protein
MELTIAIITSGEEWAEELVELMMPSASTILYFSPFPLRKGSMPAGAVEYRQCAFDACWEADLVLMTGAPLEDGVPERISDVLTRKPLVLVRREGNPFLLVESVRARYPNTIVAEARLDNKAALLVFAPKTVQPEREPWSWLRQAGLPFLFQQKETDNPSIQ